MTAVSAHYRTLRLVLAWVPALASAQQVRIDAKPAVTIGDGNDDKATLHSVLGAWRLSTGEIAIVEIGGQTPIRAFKADGTFGRVIARSGAGPGEIGPTLFSASRVGDSIVTFEFGGAKASVIDAVHGKTTSVAVLLRNVPSRPVVQGLVGRTRWLLTALPSPLRAHDDGAFRDSTFLGVATIGSDSAIVFGRTPRMALYSNNNVPGPPNMMRVRYDSLVPWTTLLTTGDRIIVADPEAAAISVFDAAGKSLPSIQVPFARVPYDPREVAKGLARSLARAKTAADSGMRRAMFGLASRPKTSPRFKTVIAGADGELWIEKFWVDEGAPREYAVVDRNGKLIARIAGAPAVRFTDFGREHAVGIVVSDDGVQTVVVHKVTR